MRKGLKIGLGLGALVVLVLVISWVWALREFPCGIGERCKDEIGYNIVTGLSGSTGGTKFGLNQSAGATQPGRAVAEDVATYNVASAPSADNNASNKTDRLIIKTANLSVVVKNVAEAIKIVGDFAEKSNGFIVSSNIYKDSLAPYGEITIRVPSAKFDEDLNNVKAIGEVKSQSVNGQDVTEQYVDLDSRLRNLQASENQFLRIMTQATKITDILAVQRELTQVRGEIEVIQGQMKYLRQSADLSSITVHLSTDPSNLPTFEDENTWKPLAVIKSATRGLASIGKGLVNVLIWFVIFIPLWLLITLVVWAVAKTMKKRGTNRI